MKTRDALALTANIILLSIIYCLVGAGVSYVLYYLFEEYDDTWQKHSTLYQMADVATEIGILAVSSFWIGYYLQSHPPFLSLPNPLISAMDSYTTGMIYMFALFLFLNGLTSKLHHLFHSHLSHHFDRIFPNAGTLVGLNLHYE